MPMRDYVCSNCGHTHEELFRTTEFQPEAIQCPGCGGRASMAMSKTSFILKGSGWYAKDYSPRPVNQCGGSCGHHGDEK